MCNEPFIDGRVACTIVAHCADPRFAFVVVGALRAGLVGDAEVRIVRLPQVVTDVR